MNEWLWVVLCLFGSIGMAQCIVWALALRRRAGRPCAGYHVIPLYDEPAQLEAQLREGIARLQWTGGARVVVLADMGLGPDSLAVCETFVRQNPGLIRCEAARLGTVVQDLEQIRHSEEGGLSSI